MTLKNLSIPSHVALAGLHEHQFRGYPVFSNLLGNISFTGMMILAIGGKKLSIEEAAILDDFATALTMADPRIWPPKIARITSCYGSFPNAMSSAFLSLSRRIGAGTVSEVAKMLLDIQNEIEKKNLKDDEAIKDIIRAHISKKKIINGFGLIGRPTDERLEAFKTRICEKKLNKKKYWRLHELVGDVVQQERHVVPNITLGGAGFLLDLGLNVEQVYQAFVLLLLIPFIGNASEGALQAPAIIQCLPKEYIADKTHAPRKSPRSQGRSKSI